MSPKVVELLDVKTRQRQERVAAGSQWRHTGFVFTTDLGDPRDPPNALRALKTAAAKADLPATVGLDTLRHSAASAMLTNGVPLRVVSEILGHSSIATTGDISGHVAPEVASSALATLGSALA